MTTAQGDGDAVEIFAPGDVQPWELPPGKVTFARQQTSYREAVWHFFNDAGNFARLKRIYGGGDRMAAVIFFYIKEFRKGRLVSTDDGITRMADEYCRAISSHKKRYYNFESRVGVSSGKDDLLWGGMVNPGVEANASDPAVSMTLPRLVAMQWFIDHDYDTLLWTEFEEVDAEYDRFMAEVKRKYTSTHRRKKQAQRKLIVEAVIGERDASAKTGRRGKKQVYLTQSERKRVRELTEADKLARRNARAASAGTKKRRQEPHSRAGPRCVSLVQAGVGSAVLSSSSREEAATDGDEEQAQQTGGAAPETHAG